MSVAKPADVEELCKRARALVGVSLAELGERLSVSTGGAAVRTKGSPGQLLERALGATGGSSKTHDFPDLLVELKTIPVDLRGVPIESTYVCTLSLADAETQTWESSWARRKLSRVLFVPLVGEDGIPWPERRIGEPLLWTPTKEQEDILRGDFDEVVGLIGIGRIEDLTAHLGRWMQVRPKAKDGSVRTLAWDSDGEPIETVPRGFYLRARFTGAILRDPRAIPE